MRFIIPEFTFERSEKGISGIHSVTMRQGGSTSFPFVPVFTGRG